MIYHLINNTHVEEMKHLYQIMRITPPPAARSAPKTKNLHLCFDQNACLFILFERS